MPETVLSVGNCGFDNGQLKQILSASSHVSLETADSVSEAIDAVDADCRLVLVNRILDRTGESGVELIEKLVAKHPQTTVMLISNYPDAQQAAESAGAAPGFGKSQMGDPALAKRLADMLTKQGGAE